MIEPSRKYTFETLLAEHAGLGLALDNEWLDSPDLPTEQTKK